jgi:hypothetical protein
MNKGIFQKINNAAAPQNSEIRNALDEQPTLADLLLPGSGHNFSDEFACLLKVLGGERESA